MALLEDSRPYTNTTQYTSQINSLAYPFSPRITTSMSKLLVLLFLSPILGYAMKTYLNRIKDEPWLKVLPKDWQDNGNAILHNDETSGIAVAGMLLAWVLCGGIIILLIWGGYKVYSRCCNVSHGLQQNHQNTMPT